jgi:hypothetical protein
MSKLMRPPNLQGYCTIAKISYYDNNHMDPVKTRVAIPAADPPDNAGERTAASLLLPTAANTALV